MHDVHGKAYDWFVYMDDDVFIRRKYLAKYVEPLDPSDRAILASGKNGGKMSKLGEPSFNYGKSPYPCSSDLEYMYPWGQPVVYSRGALMRAATGFRLGGLVKQCLEYGVTHDVGNAIYHWMMQFPELRIPFPATVNGMELTHFGSHVGKENDGNFFEIESFFESKNLTDRAFLRHWHNVTGFRSTMAYRKHGNPWTWTNVWHTMNISDCMGNTTDKLGEPFVVPPKPWIDLTTLQIIGFGHIYWRNLPDEARAAAVQLGFNESSWDKDVYPSIFQKPVDEWSLAQVDAVKFLKLEEHATLIPLATFDKNKGLG